jgi:hypothetical protein
MRMSEMKPKIFIFIFMALVLCFDAAVCAAAEEYKGVRIADKEGQYRLDDSAYVLFTLDDGVVKSVRAHVDGANKDITFASCKDLQQDGSNFTKWFAIECRKMSSFDGTPVSYEYFFIGAYAGISPVIEPTYPLYKELKAISQQLGMDLPVRTFVIYANKKPVYEFFCYPESAEMEQKSK